MTEAIPDEKIGCITPISYADYKYSDTRVPNPVDYINLVKKSWPRRKDMIKFIRYMYQILLGNFPFKSKKL